MEYPIDIILNGIRNITQRNKSSSIKVIRSKIIRNCNSGESGISGINNADNICKRMDVGPCGLIIMQKFYEGKEQFLVRSVKIPERFNQFPFIFAVFRGNITERCII